MKTQRIMMAAAGLVMLALIPSFGCAAAQAGTPRVPASPELPRELVDTSLVPSSGTTITVSAGDDLQFAFERAQPGDVIELEAGATFKGPFTLPNKRGAGWIIVKSSAVGHDFPPAGTRVNPSHAPKMAKLVARKGFVIWAEPGAHHFRFIGVEMAPTDGTFLYGIVMLGDNSAATVDELPHHIIIDRCYVHGDPKKGSRRGVALNGRHLAVIDSYVSDFKQEGHDSQAVGGWAGTGPFKVVNNYLQAAGENVLFGGSDPAIRGLVPSDIEVRGNHAAKPLAWKRGEANYDGSNWQVKIIFELKNARRVLVDGNLFEHNWQTPGYGFGIVFTVRNQDGTAPWVVVEDVTFTNNIVRHSASGINFLGFDDIHPPSEQTKRILVRNNLFQDIGPPRWGGKGILFQLIAGTQDVVIEHNTAMQSGPIVMAEGMPHEGFVYRHNVTPHNEYGMFGAGAGVGVNALETFFPRAVVTGNVIIGGDEHVYPAGNFFPPSVQFVNVERGDYRLTAAGRYTNGSDPVPGVDFARLCAALGALGRSEPVCQLGAYAGAQP